MTRLTVLPVIALASWTALAFQPGEPFKPGKLPPAEVAALQPGLTLRFVADGKPVDARLVRLAALHVPSGEPASPFLEAGPFVAKFSGYIKNPLKGTFTFRTAGTGAIKVKINDKVVLDHADASLTHAKEAEVELAKNYNRIEIDYVSPPKGDATMRLYWSGERFGFEPVPPEMLFSRKDAPDLVEQTLVREGRMLYAQLHCARCHEFPVSKVGEAPRLKMPELASTAPDLDDAGSRFQADWLTRWIEEPRSLRPEATMPHVLNGPEAPRQAADLSAYLMSLKTGAELKPISSQARAEQGEALFVKLGCNACHRLDDPKAPDELGRRSLHFVAAKFAPNAIAQFLKQPHKRHAWTRMPDFKLTDDEAGHLEAFLRDRAKGSVAAAAKGDPVRGAALWVDAGCVQCHVVPAVKPEKGVRLSYRLPPGSERGCLAEKPGAKAPDFGLTSAQRASLIALVKSSGTSLTRDTAAEFAARQVKLLQCNSCHRRDGELTRWHAVLEESGKIPELLPSLTWTGEKLKPAWTRKLLAGESDHSARPWIKARMPAFPARAELLSVGLSHEHGFGVLEDDRPMPDAKLAEIGARLIPQQGGFNCINCHGVGKTPAIAPFEAPGINLTDAAHRLRHEYYQRWMLAPDRVDVAMRMPVFAPDGKMTQLHEVFDGDARRQFGALWHFIQTLPAKK